MTKQEQQPIYVSPQVKTMEIKTQAIICQSGSNEGYSNTNGPEWF